jgi:hypothetical protein
MVMRLTRRVAWPALALLLVLALGVRAPGFAQRSQQPASVPVLLFRSADACVACHNGMTTPSGEDISFGVAWGTSMMALSAYDPYWQAGVRREIMDHPGSREAIENECSICHMPMAAFQARAAGRSAEVFANVAPATPNPTAALAMEGVSCTVCHQIQAEGLGTRASFTGGFVVDTRQPLGTRPVYGPFAVDTGRVALMHSASGFRPVQGTHVQRAELCATCHTLYTHALGPNGEVVGELPEQVPYLEWRHSAHRDERSCQSCHMPEVAEEVPIASVLGIPRQAVSRHDFVGGNFFMLRILNRYRAELGVPAMSSDLTSAEQRTIRHLQEAAASVTIERADTANGVLSADVVLRNLAGHKLPTAYPSRRAWLELRVEDAAGRALFVSGALTPRGAIVGNDNDEDARRFEPHHTVISESRDVQIYESIMADPSGVVTTGLLRAVRYVKDNRLLPRGFDKASAGEDIAVHGGAADDPDFVGGSDRVQYRVTLGEHSGPLHVHATLWYQPIAFRWADNLRAYDAPEPRRFVGYYDSMATATAVWLARDSVVVGAASR